jgi:hypothetical protein
MSKESNFFEWLVSLFKKKPVPKFELSPEEIKLKEQKAKIRARYNLEYLESYNAYFVKYLYKDQWWYLRRWDEDYTLERVRGNAIRINKPEELETVIYLHQDWISEGHIHVNFD